MPAVSASASRGIPSSVTLLRQSSDFIERNSVEGRYIVERGLKTLLSGLSPDWTALLFLAMESSQKYTGHTLRVRVQEFLKKQGVDPELFGFDHSNITRQFWRPREGEHGLHDSELVEGGIVERFEEQTIRRGNLYGITKAGEDFAKPLALAAIAFVDIARGCKLVKHQYDSMWRLLMDRGRELGTFYVVKFLAENELKTFKDSEVIEALSGKLTPAHVRFVLKDLGEAGMITRKTAGKGRNPSMHYRRINRDVDLESPEFWRSFEKAKKRGETPNKYAKIIGEYILSLEPGESDEITLRQVTDHLVSEVGRSRVRAARYVGNTMRAFAEIGFLQNTNGFDAKRRTIVRANRLTGIFYSMVLKPAHTLASTLDAKSVSAPSVTPTMITRFLQNYDEEKSDRTAKKYRRDQSENEEENH